MEEQFIARIKQFTDCSIINMNMSFKKDLFFDSLTFTKLIIDLEENFDMEFDDDMYIVGDDIRLIDLFNIMSFKLGVAS